MEKIFGFAYCSVILLFVPATYSVDILKIDFKIWEARCLRGKAIRNFILHLKCQKNVIVNSENGIEDSCIVRPFHSETVSNSYLTADNASIESICQMKPEARSQTALCLNISGDCSDIKHIIDKSPSMLHKNQTDMLSLTLMQYNPIRLKNTPQNIFDIYNIFLEVDSYDANCHTQLDCSWSLHNAQWSNWTRYPFDTPEQEITFTGTENGYLESPVISGSAGNTCLTWNSKGFGNISLQATSIDSQKVLAFNSFNIESKEKQGHVWDFGKIDVPFIVRFRLIESSSYFISVADVAFTDCKRDSYRNCSFETPLPCPLVETYHGCSLVRTKGDPHKDIEEWMLLTRKDYCKNNNVFTASFTTVTFPPVLGSNICYIHLTTYGNLRWHWRICFLNKRCSNRTIPGEINATPSLHHYAYPISNVSQRFKLEFSTVHLDSRTFLGVIRIAFSESCFPNSNSSSTTVIPQDFAQSTVQGEPSTYMVAAILILCFLILFIILLGIVRKRKRLCLNYKSTDSLDNKVSIHDFLASKSVEKTLEDILTEGNPNYRWYSHRLLKGTIVEIDKSQIQINTLLGRGAFGEVFRGILLGRERNGNNTDIAVKRLSKSADEQSQDKFLLEALILFKFQHKNIVKCLGISSSNGGYMILLELMLGGDLKTFLRNTKDKQTQKSTLKVSELLRLAGDIACGLNYLESLHFVHRDVAARNCLLTNLGPNRVAKLGDFGLAKDILLHDYYRKEGTALLPIRWMPPEAFLEGYFSSKSDVWAFGVLMWEIFTSGFIPYPGLQNNDVMTFVRKGGRLEIPAICPQSIYDLMCWCWQNDTVERPSFQTIYKFLVITHKKFQSEECFSNDQCNEDRSSPRYCSKVFNEEESSPLMLIDEICRGGM